MADGWCGRTGRRLVDGGLVAALVLYLALTAATFFGRERWFADLVTHFRPQLLAAAALLAALMLLARRASLLLPLAAAAAIHLVVLLQPAARPLASGPGPGLRLVQFNLFANNQEYDAVLAFLRGQRADVLVLEEASPPWRKRLRALRDLFPYSTADLPGGEEAGQLVVMSRLPIRQLAVELPRYRSGERLSLPALRLELATAEGAGLVLWAVHPPSPTDRWNWRVHTAYLSWVAAEAGAERAGTPVIVAGDFNQTPWTSWHRAFLAVSGLIDAAGTSWPAATRRPFWPFSSPLLAIPIDRIAVRPGIGVTALAVGPALGSDHSPVTADLILGRPPPAARSASGQDPTSTSEQDRPSASHQDQSSGRRPLL